MTRKAITVMLSVGAIGVAAVSALSYSSPIRPGHIWLGDRGVFVFVCDAGHAELNWLGVAVSDRSLYVGRLDDTDQIGVLVSDQYVAVLNRITPGYIPRLRWKTKLATQPPSQWTQIHVWTWMVVAALAAYPIVTLFSGPLRRHRRRNKGLCIVCGYDLHGNLSGKCPECGTSIGPSSPSIV